MQHLPPEMQRVIWASRRFTAATIAFFIPKSPPAIRGFRDVAAAVLRVGFANFFSSTQEAAWEALAEAVEEEKRRREIEADIEAHSTPNAGTKR